MNVIKEALQEVLVNRHASYCTAELGECICHLEIVRRALPAAEAVEGLVKALVMVQDVERLQKEGKPVPLEFMYRKVNEALTTYREATK